MALENVEVLLKDEVICQLDVDYDKNYIRIYNIHLTKESDWIFLPFGKRTKPTWKEFTDYLADRCFPQNRSNVKELLKLWGLDRYDPWLIVHKTHGVMNDDFVWFRFNDEKLTFNEVRMR